jgi:hypothetical protein
MNIIDKGVDALVEKEEHAYTCGFLTGAVKSLAILAPEYRAEIVRMFSPYINIEEIE